MPAAGDFATDFVVKFTNNKLLWGLFCCLLLKPSCQLLKNILTGLYILVTLLTEQLSVRKVTIVQTHGSSVTLFLCQFVFCHFIELGFIYFL